MSFECCTSKLLNYYVCKNCSGIYHKSVEKKYKVQFFGGKKNCGDDVSANAELENLSLL